MNQTDTVCPKEPPDKTNEITFCILDDETQDFFDGIYQSPYIKLAMSLTYGVAIICMIGLGFVLWFERSGQAGQYRTLVNQLSSFNLDQVDQSKKICPIKNYSHKTLLRDKIISTSFLDVSVLFFANVSGFAKSLVRTFSNSVMLNWRLYQERCFNQCQPHHGFPNLDKAHLHLCFQENSHHG